MFISWGEDVCRISGSSHAASGVDKARIARSVELINFYDTLPGPLHLPQRTPSL